jgi:hypothetical protein
MTRLANRNCVVIEQRNRAPIARGEFTIHPQPIVIGPFKSYRRACERRDEIAEYMLDHTDLEDGVDFDIHAIGCHSATTTTNEEIEGILTTP